LNKLYLKRHESVSAVSLVAGSLDGANEDGDEVSGVLAGGEVGLGGPVGAHGGDVRRHGALVEHVVLGHGRREAGGLLEDLGPGLDGSDIVAHALAWSNILLEVEDEGLNGLEGGEDVEGLKVGKSRLEEAVERGDASVARLHLGEVVVTDHAVDETGSELGKHQEVQVEVVLLNFIGILDRAESDGEKVCESLTRVLI